jgi:tripartite-type tricarboxylate transporter receptor subunit TctC
MISRSIVSVFVAFTLSEPVLAQDWPARPLTAVVPFAAGTGSDVFARILLPRLSELLGRQVIVENIGGAGGLTGTLRVAKAAPDGYQFVIGNTGTHAVNQTVYKNPPYNAATDFAPVALILDQPTVLTARKDFPAGDLNEFIAYTKANEAKLQYGSAGIGSITHLACALLNSAIGVKVTHIPYRGGGPAMQDLVAGLTDYQCPGAVTAIPQVDGKTIRAIAILSKNRSAMLASLPSAHEQGLTNFDVSSWTAAYLPKDTPLPTVQKLNAAIVAAMDTPSVRDRLKELGGDVVAPERRTPAYLQKFTESEIEKWAAPIKDAGMKLE